MAGLTERLAILITGDSKDAVNAFQNVGKAADTDLVKAEKGLDRVGARMQSMGAQAVAAGAVVATGLYQAVQSTQDLADSWDKAEASFGSRENGLVEYADAAAESMGKSKAAALDTASAYALLLKGTGLEGPDLTSVATGLSVRAADLAEKYKRPFEAANEAISSSIKTGSQRALKGLLDYGISISDVDVKTEAMTLGIAKQGDALTRQQKALAVSSLIMKESAKDANTFANSTDDVGVKIEQMKANWENAQADFGQSALPAATAIADTLGNILETVNNLPAPVKEVGSELAVVATGALLVGGALSMAGGAAINLKSSVTTALSGAATGADKMTAATGLMTVAAIGWGTFFTENARQAEAAIDALLPKAGELKAVFDPQQPLALKVQADMDAGVLLKTQGAAPQSWVDRRLDSIGQYDGGAYEWENRVTLAEERTKDLIAEMNTLSPEQGRQFLETYRQTLFEFGGTVEQVDAVMAPFKAELDKNGAIERATKSTAAYDAALKSAVPGVAELASALEAAGIPIEQVDAVMASLDPTAAAASQSIDQFAAAAEAAGIPLDKLAAALDAAGVKVDTFASKQAAASAKVASASNLVIGHERALLRQGKAQDALDGLADKQASDQRAANDAVEDATDAVTDAIKRRTKAQAVLNDLNKKSAVAGSVPLLQEITRAAAEMETQAQAAARVAEATYGVGSDQAINANRAAADAGRRKDQAGGFLNQALAEQEGRNAQERADAADAVVDADKAVSRASRDRADAQKQSDETLANAATERKEAELDLFEATLATTDAQGRLAAAVADGAAPVDALRGALQSAFDQGLITAEQFLTLTALLDGMAAAAAAFVAAAPPPATSAHGPPPPVDPYGYPVDGHGNRLAGPPATPGWVPPVDAPSFTDILLGNTPIATKSQTINNFNISAVDPYETAAEIAKRNRLKVLERKLGR